MTHDSIKLILLGKLCKWILFYDNKKFNNETIVSRVKFASYRNYSNIQQL